MRSGWMPTSASTCSHSPATPKTRPVAGRTTPVHPRRHPCRGSRLAVRQELRCGGWARHRHLEQRVRERGAPLTIEISAEEVPVAHGTVFNVVKRMLVALWGADIRAVAACDFED